MSKKQFIENNLIKYLEPTIMQVENESYMHQVPEGSESHFKIIVVSNKFANLSRIARHRLVFSVLSNEFKSIHALTMSLYTPSEWTNKSQEPKSSPQCAHKKLESQ